MKNSDEYYKQKYLKYKTKYEAELFKQYGGSRSIFTLPSRISSQIINNSIVKYIVDTYYSYTDQITQIIKCEIVNYCHTINSWQPESKKKSNEIINKDIIDCSTNQALINLIDKYTQQIINIRYDTIFPNSEPNIFLTGIQPDILNMLTYGLLARAGELKIKQSYYCMMRNCKIDQQFIDHIANPDNARRINTYTYNDRNKNFVNTTYPNDKNSLLNLNSWLMRFEEPPKVILEQPHNNIPVANSNIPQVGDGSSVANSDIPRAEVEVGRSVIPIASPVPNNNNNIINNLINPRQGEMISTFINSNSNNNNNNNNNNNIP